MFENILGRNKEERNAQAAEDRDRDFTKQRDVFNSSIQPDQEYMQMQESRTDLLKWQQSLEDELTKLKHRLRGEHLTDEGWKPKLVRIRTEEGIIETNSPPLANDIFVDYIEIQVEPFLSRNLLNSNFDEKRILEMLKNTMNTIADAMADGWDLYGIEFINYDLIDRLIKNIITPSPFRALNDGERRHQRTISKRIEAIQDNNGIVQQKKGLFGGFGNG